MAPSISDNDPILPPADPPERVRVKGWRDEAGAVPDDDWADESESGKPTAGGRAKPVRRSNVLTSKFRDHRTTANTHEAGPKMRGKDGYQRRPIQDESSELAFLSESIPGVAAFYGREWEAREALRNIDSLLYRRYHDPRMPVTQSDEVHSYLIDHNFLDGSQPEDEAALLPVVQALQNARRTAMTRGFNVIATAPDLARGPLEATFNAFLASHECYNLIRHGTRSDALSGADAVLETLRRTDNESVKRLAPLMVWLASPQMSAAVRAEAMAHLQMYVKSGWASRDLGDSPTTDVGVTQLRRLAKALVEGRPVSAAELTETIQARFDAVFLRARVRHTHKDRRGCTLEAMPEGSRRFSMTAGTVQGSGVPDVLIRSETNPSDLMLASVTAEKDVVRQRDQLIRHANAVIAAAQSGTPPCQPGDRLAEIQFFSLALMPEEGANSLRRDMRTAFTFSGLPWDDRVNSDFFNLLPLFSMLGTDVHGGLLDPGVVLRTRHLRFGAGNTPFDATVGEEEQAVKAAQFLVDGALQLALAMPCLRLGHPPGQGKALRDDMRLTFEMLKDSLQGMLAHYGSLDLEDPTLTPERRDMSVRVRAELARAAPALVTIAEHAQAQADSVRFSTDMFALATQLDGVPRSSRVYTLPDGRRVRALSFARATKLGVHESSIAQRQEKALGLRDARLAETDVPSTLSAYRVIGNSVVRLAARVDDSMIERLIGYGNLLFSRVHSTGSVSKGGEIIRTLDDLKQASDVSDMMDTWDHREQARRRNASGEVLQTGMMMHRPRRR